MKQGKHEFRVPYFNELYKVQLAVAGGAIVASVTFLENINNVVKSKYLFMIGFGSLVLAIVLQLLMSFMNAVASGYYWDAVVLKDDNSNRDLGITAKIISSMLVAGILATIVGVIALSIFTGVNL